ncbi:MAG: PaaI family thioesterase [Armatimonadota bacterium]
MPRRLDLGDDDGCFACGKANEYGLQLEFEAINGEYVTYFTPQKRHQGYVGITHGGLVSTVLDEVMTRYAHSLGHNAVTGEITVRFKRPAKVGHRLRFVGRIESENSRMLLMSADATDEDGTQIAEASAKIIKVKGNEVSR